MARNTLKYEKIYSTDGNVLLSISEAAHLLCVAASTVKKLVDQKKIKCLLSEGKHRRFKKSEVLKYKAKMEAAQK
ncbi:MAG TPA: excisionase family DNA-binding protein [Chryseosolibacter sp.]|nr:excisionase family DNA-binding protein [Chryseosolibacter sp.]